MSTQERDFLDHPERLPGFVVRATNARVGVVVDANEHALLVRAGRVRLLAMLLGGRNRLVIPARAVASVDPARREVILDRSLREVRRIPQPEGGGRAPIGIYYPGSTRIPGLPPVIPTPPTPDEEP